MYSSSLTAPPPKNFAPTTFSPSSSKALSSSKNFTLDDEEDGFGSVSSSSLLSSLAICSEVNVGPCNDDGTIDDGAILLRACAPSPS